MSNLQFDDKDEGLNYKYTPNTQKGMVGWLIKKGIAPNQKVAEIILIVAAVIIFGASLVIFNRRNSTPTQSPNDLQDEEIYNEDFGEF